MRVTAFGFSPASGKRVSITDTAAPVIIKGHRYRSGKKVIFRAYFTPLRIKKSPEGYLNYSLRESDDGEGPVSVESFVVVNHYGDIVTNFDLRLNRPYLDYIIIDSFLIQ